MVSAGDETRIGPGERGIGKRLWRKKVDSVTSLKWL